MLPRIIYELLKNRPYKKTTISYGGHRLRVELADTLAKGAIGLMYRDGLKNIDGMLFAFPFEHAWKVWMLNMRFPLDVVWLDRTRRVVHVEKNLKPCESVLSCRSYAPNKGAKYAVELRTGTVARLGIRVGEMLRFRI